MPEELLERHDIPEVEIVPEESLVPPAPPEGLDTALYEHDEHASRADLRRQIAALELELARLFGSAFPRKGIDFSVAGMGGPRLLSVDELEKVRDGLAARVQDVRLRLDDVGYVHEKNRELIEAMLADPVSHKWVRVNNEDIGEPGCKHWHATPRWGPLGMLMGWWRVKISSGCPLATGLRPPEQRWRRSDSAASGGGVRQSLGDPFDPRRRQRAPRAARIRPTGLSPCGDRFRSRSSSSSSPSSCSSSASSPARRSPWASGLSSGHSPESRSRRASTSPATARTTSCSRARPG